MCGKGKVPDDSVEETVEETKLPEKAAEAESEEPGNQEQVRGILQGLWVSGAAYGLVRLFATSERTEDIVDMAHSLVSSSMALFGFASMETHSLHMRALPSALSSGSGPIVRMFKMSTGFFTADLLLIISSLASGHRPNLWQGRLIHHFVQFGANAPAIFAKEQPREQVIAWRSVLCMAYIAELSSIFLRLSNLTRSAASLRLRRAVNLALLFSFLGSRIVNFPTAISMFVKARPVLHPRLFNLGLGVQAAGYLMNAVWFVKIFQIALKTSRGRRPSIEC
mmetsp:Transcript_127599/g.285438  ORF Transcript_127599/g.285438 Transcript_127599/m.285438 type:complete len:280 (+) Transcript_127599:56-895(+)